MTAPCPPVDETSPEPVLIASGVQAILVAVGALGWTVIDDARIAAIVTAVSTVGTVVTAMIARGRVRAIRPADPPRAVDHDALLEEVRAAVRAELDAARPSGDEVWRPAAAHARPYVDARPGQ